MSKTFEREGRGEERKRKLRFTVFVLYFHFVHTAVPLQRQTLSIQRINIVLNSVSHADSICLNMSCKFEGRYYEQDIN